MTFDEWLTARGFVPGELTDLQRLTLQEAFEADTGETLAERMNGPQTVTIDGVSVTERSVADLIAAEQHNAAQTAAAAPYGMRLARMRPGSARGE